MQQRMLVVLNALQKLEVHNRHCTAAAAALCRAQATKSSADTCALLHAPSCTAYTTGTALTSGQLTSAVTHTVASTVAGLMTGKFGPVQLSVQQTGQTLPAPTLSLASCLFMHKRRCTGRHVFMP